MNIKAFPTKEPPALSIVRFREFTTIHEISEAGTFRQSHKSFASNNSNFGRCVASTQGGIGRRIKYG